MNKDIFISYASNDRLLAQNTMRQLHRKGLLENEYIEHLEGVEKPGEAKYLREKIKERILRSDLVVLIWSKDAAKSPWVQYEVGMAKALERPILIAWADKSAPELPTEIKENQIVRLEGEPA